MRSSCERLKQWLLVVFIYQRNAYPPSKHLAPNNDQKFYRIFLVASSLLLIGSEVAFAQFTLSAEVRPRAKFRDDFKTGQAAGETPAFFIEQRSRLSANYEADKLRLRMSLQDVRVWGTTSQRYKSAPSLFNVYEAYGKFQFTSGADL